MKTRSKSRVPDKPEGKQIVYCRAAASKEAACDCRRSEFEGRASDADTCMHCGYARKADADLPFSSSHSRTAHKQLDPTITEDGPAQLLIKKGLLALHGKPNGQVYQPMSLHLGGAHDIRADQLVASRCPHDLSLHLSVRFRYLVGNVEMHGATYSDFHGCFQQPCDTAAFAREINQRFAELLRVTICSNCCCLVRTEDVTEGFCSRCSASKRISAFATKDADVVVGTDDVCVLCRQGFKAWQSVARTDAGGCRHAFHLACIARLATWKCPLGCGSFRHIKADGRFWDVNPPDMELCEDD